MLRRFTARVAPPDPIPHQGVATALSAQEIILHATDVGFQPSHTWTWHNDLQRWRGGNPAPEAYIAAISVVRPLQLCRDSARQFSRITK
jgi:hypothetical protein